MTAATLHQLPTSDQIRIAACELFCRKGYKGVGMRSIADAVGIGAGSLYNHIVSKQALLYELISSHELNLLWLLKSKKLTRAKTSSQLVAALWEQFETYVTENKNMTLLARTELCHLTENQAREISTLRSNRVAELRRLLSRMPDSGLGEQGLKDVSEELYTLLECNANLIADESGDANKFVRRQIRNMASMLMVKRD